jgi:tetratricopeptide (TPR) repeat protein
MVRRFLFLGWLIFLGWQTLAAWYSEAGGVTQDLSALDLWSKGQSAMQRGEPDAAILFYRKSLAADPGLTRNYLSLAVAFLEKGEDSAACEFLSHFLTFHPTHLTARAQLAELLLRQDRVIEARAHFLHYLKEAQDQGENWLKQRIQVHSRLLELAERAEDAFEEHLHRGIGFFLLAQRQEVLGEGQGGLTTQGLLCKAAGELTAARRLRENEAQPWWYLHRVWRQLGQPRQAQRCLKQAGAWASFSFLTPAERQSLHLALHDPL